MGGWEKEWGRNSTVCGAGGGGGGEKYHIGAHAWDKMARDTAAHQAVRHSAAMTRPTGWWELCLGGPQAPRPAGAKLLQLSKINWLAGVGFCSRSS